MPCLKITCKSTRVQRPFGGAGASVTNDKAGSKLNLLRWVSPRMIKETFVTPADYRYPFMG
jgi:1-pyrroline-5-carboxylate dehydrogenase